MFNVMKENYLCFLKPREQQKPQTALCPNSNTLHSFMHTHIHTEQTNEVQSKTNTVKQQQKPTKQENQIKQTKLHQQ